MLQWGIGSYSEPSGGNRKTVVVTFPIAFPNAISSVAYSQSGPLVIASSYNKTTTSVKFVLYNTSGSAGATQGYTWIAVGY